MKQLLRYKWNHLEFKAARNDTVSTFYHRSPARPFIAIRSQHKDTSPDGSYTFGYETENGISVSERGYPQAGPQGQTEVKQSSRIVISCIYLTYLVQLRKIQLCSEVAYEKKLNSLLLWSEICQNLNWGFN